MKKIKRKTITVSIKVTPEQKVKIEETAIRKNLSITDLFLTTIEDKKNESN